MVLGGISELKNLIKKKNKNEKIWEHICEIIEDSILEKYAKTLKSEEFPNNNFYYFLYKINIIKLVFFQVLLWGIIILVYFR